jgi:Cu/Ag efflux protein CusF
MNVRLLALLLACLAPAVVASAQDHSAHGSAEKSAAKTYPLTGVVVDVLADKGALLVKHDEIPGVMRAMTMMFRVEADVLAQVKKGDAIKAQMGRNDEGKWILRDVQVVPKG